MYKIRLFSLIFILTAVHIVAFAQQLSTIKGKVTTIDGKPVAYVSVGLKGKGQGNVSNDSGLFEIGKVKPGSYTLKVSAVGIKSVEKEIIVTAGQDLTIDFTVVQNASQLSEVDINSSKANKYATKQSAYVSKMPINNLENPQVYTTITKDLLTDQMVFSVDDAVTRNAAGFQRMWESTGRAGDGGSYFSSRGFIVQSKLRNGIAGNVTSRIDGVNIDHIEVIKGPSATLFGSALTSYGGLINRVTKKPYDTLGGEVSYSKGSYDFERVTFDFNTPIDKKNQIYMRLNGGYNYEGSFQDAGFDKNFIFAPSLTYKVNDRLRFDFDAELSYGTNIGKSIIFFYFPVADLGFSNAKDAGLDYKRSYTGNDLTQQYKTNNVFAQATYKISEKWTSQTNITNTYSFSNGRGPYFFLVPNNYPALGNPNAGPGADFLSRGDQSTDHGEAYATEIQQNFNGEFNIGSVKNRVVIGLDYLRQKSNIKFYSIDSFDVIPKSGNTPAYGNFNETNLAAFYANARQIPGQVSTYPINTISNTYSAYISDVVNITNNLIALAALRIDRFDNQGNYDEALQARTGAYKQTAYSPKFGLVYQPIKDQISIFANYQNGFNNVGGRSATGETFKPEQANQIEGGVKLDAFNGKLSSTISYYHIKVQDIVRTDPNNQNFSIQNGTKISKGIEAEVLANPFAGLNIVAGFSYNDNKLVNADVNVEGRRDAYSMSPYTANLWISYKLLNGGLRGAGVGFGGNYASDNKIVNSASMGVFTLPAFTTLNATLFYDKPKYRIGAKVDNLTNQEYWIGYGTMNPQKLRSFTGSISYKF